MQITQAMQEQAIEKLKALRFDVTYERDSDNTITCWTDNGIKMWGNGPTYYLAREDLINSLRTCADIYLREFDEFYAHNPEQLPYIMLVMTSSDDELRKLLTPDNFPENEECERYETLYDYYIVEDNGKLKFAKCRSESEDEDPDEELPADIWEFMKKSLNITEADLHD